MKITNVDSCLVAALMALVSSSTFALAGEPPGNDQLPVGVIARLGSTAWRHPANVTWVQFSENGKKLISRCDQNIVKIHDLATGEFTSIGAAQGYFHPGALSRDGTLFAADDEKHVRIWKVETGKQIARFKSPPGEMQFGTNNRLVFIGPRIEVRDVQSGKLVRTLLEDSTRPQMLKKFQPEQFVLSPNAMRYLIIFNHEDKQILTVWDWSRAKLLAHVAVASSGHRPHFSPNGELIGRPEPDGTVQLYQTGTLRKLQVLGKPTKEGSLKAISFSPDGKTIATITPKGTIRLLEVTTGKIRREIGELLPPSFHHVTVLSQFGQRAVVELGEGNGKWLAWSSDCVHLAQAWGPCIRVWDSQTGKEKGLGAGHVGPVSDIRVAPDGKTVMTTGSDNTVRKWDLALAKEQLKKALPAETSSAQFLTMQRALLATEDHSVMVWDIRKDKQLLRFQDGRPALLGSPSVPCLFLRDPVCQNQFLLSVIQINESFGTSTWVTRLYNLRTGKPQRGLLQDWIKKPQNGAESITSILTPANGSIQVATFRPIHLPPQLGGFGGGFGGFSRKPDECFVRCQSSGSSSKQIWEQPLSRGRGAGDTNFARALGITPDQRAILVIDEDIGFPGWRIGDHVRLSVLETTTGQIRFQEHVESKVESPTDPGQWAYAISRNSNLLAVSPKGKTITLIDLRRGRIIRNLDGGQGIIHSLAFGVGATLLSGGSDGTVLMWDLTRVIRKNQRNVKLSPDDQKRLWEQLANGDADNAYRAVATLIDAREQTVALLADKLTPIQTVSETQIQKLIAELDNRSFQAREKATKQLHRIGGRVLPALKHSLAKSKSLEQGTRLQRLIASLHREALIPGRDELRQLRALEVLEVIGSPEAKTLLRRLSAGAPKVRLTEEARLVLSRLKGVTP